MRLIISNGLGINGQTTAYKVAPPYKSNLKTKRFVRVAYFEISIKDSVCLFEFGVGEIGLKTIVQCLYTLCFIYL